MKLHSENKLLPLIQQDGDYEYDLIVIGGGSGGLAAAKVSAECPCFLLVRERDVAPR